MYSIVKSVIEGGGYDLPAILNKIDVLWVQGNLTGDEKDELKTLARAGATPQTGIDLFSKIQELETRVKALEGSQAEGDSPEATAEEFVEGGWYYNGDKCIWKGTTYVCTAPDGVACVWSPEAYPAYWSSEE